MAVTVLSKKNQNLFIDRLVTLQRNVGNYPVFSLRALRIEFIAMITKMAATMPSGTQFEMHPS